MDSQVMLSSSLAIPLGRGANRREEGSIHLLASHGQQLTELGSDMGNISYTFIKGVVFPDVDLIVVFLLHRNVSKLYLCE